MPKLLRLAVMERDLAVALSKSESEDEAVEAVLSAAVSYSPGCGVAVFASTGEWDAIRTRGPAAQTACALAMNARFAGSGADVRGALVHLPEKRGVSGRLAFVGPCAAPRPVLARVAGLLSAALVRIAVERTRNVTAKDRALLESELLHRTRNSLSVIKRSISFLIGSLSHASTEMLEAIDERLNALMIVHDMLGRTCSDARVSVESYFGQLAEALRGITPEGVGTVIAYYDAEESVTISIDRAATIGLIVHELVMNTIKHASGALLRMSVRIDYRLGALQLRYEECAVPPFSGNAQPSVRADAVVSAPGGAGLKLIDGLLERARGERLDDGRSFSSFAAAFPVD